MEKRKWQGLFAGGDYARSCSKMRNRVRTGKGCWQTVGKLGSANVHGEGE